MRKIVLLPEPFGPSRPTTSPGWIAKDTSVTARRGPYHLVTCCASTTGGMLLTDYLRLTRNEKKASKPGLAARVCSDERPSVGCLFVVFRRVLLCLEAIRIVRHEDAGAFRIAHSPHPRIGIEHAGRIVDAAEA